MVTKEQLTEIRNKLDIDEMFSYLELLGADPVRRKEDLIVCCTCCHNGPHCGSHKLYYYGETHTFRCYSGCGDEPLFDVYELTKRVETFNGKELNYITAAKQVLRFFNQDSNIFEEKEGFRLQKETDDYFKDLSRYNNISHKLPKEQIVDIYDIEINFLKNFPQPIIMPWIRDGITKDVMEERDIRYNPINDSIIIPHYDVYGQLIGIRERTLIKENEIYGKYKPMIFQGIQYNHPLGLNLYGINWAKENISRYKKAIVFESEKGTMQYESYFGTENNIAVATCGSNLTKYQVKLLLEAGAEEIIIAFDKQGENDKKEDYVKKFYGFQEKYGNLCTLSFIYDKNDKYLDYKQSPTDVDKDTFLALFKERIQLYG